MKQVYKLSKKHAHSEEFEFSGYVQDVAEISYERGFREALELVIEFMKTKHINAQLKKNDIYDDGTFILNLKEIRKIADEEVE